MTHLLGLNLKELEEALSGYGQPAWRAGQILSWVYKKGVWDFGAMSDLSESLRGRLEKDFFVRSLKLKKTLESADGTRKFLFELKDGNLIEAVGIPAELRLTGCISSQAGCRFACRFCASFSRGFKRNLTCGEIIEQALFINSQAKLTHIVFMGVGEPLDNYDNVLKAARIINSAQGLHIGARRVTISTCGIIPGIKKLAQENLQIELSVSLHAPSEALRSRLLPVNKKYPLKELILGCEDYIRQTGRQITFEYVLINGLNSDLQNAAFLCKIIKGLKTAKVNLIPVNPVKELNIEPPGKLDILLFRDFLLKQGVNATLRKPRGKDIEAACGQLRAKYEKTDSCNSCNS